MEDTQNSKEAIRELTKVTMVLFDNFQRENQAMFIRMTGLDQEVRQTLNQSQQAITDTAKITQQQLAVTIERILDEKLDHKMEDLEKNLQARTNQLHEAFNHFAEERKHLAKQTWIISWKGILGIIIGMIIMVIGSVVLTLNQKEKLDAIVAEYNDVKFKTEAITAEERMIKIQCGDKLCIKIDPKENKWGENGEYVIPILKN